MGLIWLVSDYIGQRRLRGPWFKVQKTNLASARWRDVSLDWVVPPNCRPIPQGASVGGCGLVYQSHRSRRREVIVMDRGRLALDRDRLRSHVEARAKQVFSDTSSHAHTLRITPDRHAHGGLPSVRPAGASPPPRPPIYRGPAAAAAQAAPRPLAPIPVQAAAAAALVRGA